MKVAAYYNYCYYGTTSMIIKETFVELATLLLSKNKKEYIDYKLSSPEHN